MKLKQFTTLFLQHTRLTRRHLTPELSLRLITRECPLWTAPVGHSPFTDPYWGFYWPGGQAVARYILDNEKIVRNRNILDVGCGCGAGAVAASKMKAKRIVANDIDIYALEATRINAENNDVKVETNANNFIGAKCEEFDAILIGDMFYDEDFARILFDWLSELASNGKTVLIGDPGRHGLTQSRRSQMSLLARYKLQEQSCMENNGFTETTVWKLNS
ncbi:electron transfer flavoprotein beta subunit lysine methyltransferase-like [Colias croceus]|uniref:electron transfer flavoprotein beta subunit lysine methyltransferase-like n=1 Tax=Colias crocea TaxID=72248 RepID=UPI001E27DF11|nr:electron transfer flavoprotein beta subunit lysine methyltransferase-like [Colias croceus]XP_045506930.1 electron transfer flavoprotein beta subunit lysine methyltransferase-like [Colias croceus]